LPKISLLPSAASAGAAVERVLHAIRQSMTSSCRRFGNSVTLRSLSRGLVLPATVTARSVLLALRPSARSRRGHKLRWWVGLALTALGGLAVPPSIAAPLSNTGIQPSKGAAAPASGPQGEAQQVSLRGLRLVKNAASVQPNGGQTSGVVIEHIPMLETPEFRKNLQVFLGQPISQQMLQSITTLINDWYRGHDYPFVDVAFPAGQDITNGNVQLVIAESRAGKILATGNHWFSSSLLTDQVRLAPGDRISLSRLEADKDWLNQNPFRVVNIVAQKSAEPGYTDFTVETVQEELPLRARAGFSNNGVPIIGRDQWSYGLDWGNALWLDQQFSYTFTSSLPVWRWGSAMTFQDHTASYAIALPWHDKLVLLGDYAKAKPELGPDLGLTGINSQLSARYVLALPSIGRLTQNLQLGFDFKSSNNNLQFGGTQVLDVTTQVYQFSVVYSGALKDSLGQTTLDNNLVFSPGNFNSHNSDDEFGVQAPFAKARYVYDNLAITRLTGLPQDADWVDQLGWFKNTSSLTRVIAQISDVNLLPSEQLGIGGTDTIPGYDPRRANGSQGVFVSEELLLPAFSISKQFFQSDLMDQTQFSAFWAYGEVRDKKTAPDAPMPPVLESVGIGLRFVASPYLNLRANYGWQLRKLPGADNHGAFGHVALTFTY
jgi:hemolysin activation/secretion protein